MLTRVATVIVLILALAGPLIVALTARQFGAGVPLLSQTLAVLAIAGLVVLVVAAVFWGGQPLSSIGLVRPTVTSILLGAVIAAVYIAVIGPLLMRLPGWLGLPGFEGGLGELTRLPVWCLALSVLVVASAEEILYRGYAIETLTAVTGSLWAAAFISVLAFGLAHLPLWGWGPALTTFIWGAIATVLYIWLRDLTPLIIAHVATDMVGLIGPYLARSGS